MRIPTWMFAVVVVLASGCSSGGDEPTSQRELTWRGLHVLGAHPVARQPDGTWAPACSGEAQAVRVELSLLGSLDSDEVRSLKPDEATALGIDGATVAIGCVETDDAPAPDCDEPPRTVRNELRFEAPLAAGDGIGVVLLVDQSGSTNGLVDGHEIDGEPACRETTPATVVPPTDLNFCASDPHDDRISAATRFVGELDAEVKLAVMAFNEDVGTSVVCDVPHDPSAASAEECYGRNRGLVTSPEGTSALDRLRREGRGRSNLWQAVLEARAFLETVEQASRHVIVLVDGPDTCTPERPISERCFPGPEDSAAAACGGATFTELRERVQQEPAPVRVSFVHFPGPGYTGPDPRMQQIACLTGGHYRFVDLSRLPRPGTARSSALGDALADVAGGLAGHWSVVGPELTLPPGTAVRASGELRLEGPVLEDEVAFAAEGGRDERLCFTWRCATDGDCGGTDGGELCGNGCDTDSGLCFSPFPCAPGQAASCNEDRSAVVACGDDGSSWVEQPCLADTEPSVCIASPEPHCARCVPGAADACSEDGLDLRVCNAEGSDWGLLSCLGETGIDLCLTTPEPHCAECRPGQVTGCNADGTSLVVCGVDGHWAEEMCFDDGAAVPCLGSGADAYCAACAPGEEDCDEAGENVVACREDRSGFDVQQACEPEATGRACREGACVSLCDLAVAEQSSVGCRFWAADLDNAFVACGGRTGFCDAAGQPWALVVANASPDYACHFEIERWDAAQASAVPVAVDVDGEPLSYEPIPPGGARVFRLPRADVDGTTVAPLAYRLVSRLPVTAYQFNPYKGDDVFSNEASRLLPEHALGLYYLAMTRQQTFAMLRSYVTVIATSPGTTTVHVSVPTTTLASLDGSIPSLQAGDTLQRELAQFEILNVETDAIGADPTGAVVLADQPVAVFGGSEAANAPDTGRCVDEPDHPSGLPVGVCEWDGSTPCASHADCAQLVTCCSDHLEEQLPPVPAWGERYVAARSEPRGQAPDYWRILAARDGTQITTHPHQRDLPTLDQGEWVELESHESFEIVSNDRPILVGQFLASEQAPAPQSQPGDAGIGDPSFLLTTAVAQYRSAHTLFVPDGYEQSYLTIVAPTAAELHLDGVALEPGIFEIVGTSDFRVTTVPVEPGRHHIDATQPVGVSIYGWSTYVSYGYSGTTGALPLNDLP